MKFAETVEWSVFWCAVAVALYTAYPPSLLAILAASIVFSTSFLIVAVVSRTRASQDEASRGMVFREPLKKAAISFSVCILSVVGVVFNPFGPTIADRLFISRVEPLLAEHFGEGHYSVKVSEKRITFSVWMDGFVLLSALSAAFSDEGTGDSWGETVSSIGEAAAALSDAAKKEGVRKHIQLNIVNDVDHSSVLATFIDGVQYRAHK